jgi:lipopolysaccharide biosynthesis regulator YciM
MRYILLAVLVILLIGLCIYVALLNPAPVVVTLPWLGTYKDVPLIVVMLTSVLCGVVVSFGIFLVKEMRRSFKHLGEARKVKRSEFVERQHTRGVQLVVSGYPDEAIHCFNKILNKDPKNVEAHIALGDVYFSIGDWDQAARCHSRALEVNGGDAGLMLKLVQDYQRAGKIDGAIDVLQKIIQADESNITARIRLRELYCNQGHWHKACELQQQVVALVKSKPNKLQEQNILWGLKCGLAGTQAADGQQQEAIKALKEIIKADKHFLPAYIQLAEVYQKQKRLDEAIQVLEKGYRQNQSLILLKRLEELSLSRDDPQRAIETYRRAIQNRPQAYGLYLFLGMLYLKLEMLEEAKEQFQYLIRQGKDFPLLHYELAGVQERQMQYQQSCQEYKRAFLTQDAQLLRYDCGECGATFPHWEGRCHHCGRWNTINWLV